MGFASEKNHSDKERWVCIYPAYINSLKTRASGRRIPKTQAVMNPNYEEMRDVLSAAGLTVGVENKLYPRESSKEMLYRGRIRVQLKNDDGSPALSMFPTRDALLMHLAENIPKLKSRQNRTVEGQEAQTAGAAAPAPAAAGKKKGKRGTRTAGDK